jgi:galactose mutarotase-like enzyme
VRDTLTLESGRMQVSVVPDKGADICSIRERSRSMELLFQAPWRGSASRAAPLGLGSQVAWLQRYTGGWQVLCPNAGDERDAYGTRWGYHGEASLVPWTVEQASRHRAIVSVELLSAPLAIVRELELEDDRLIVRQRVTNTSPETIRYAWVEHPAFGSPLIGPGCRLYTGAKSIVSDPATPGSLLGAGLQYPWPSVTDTSGNPLDLQQFPPPSSPRSVFACLTKFDTPFCAFSNSDLRLGVALRWTQHTHPYAWLWQELHATSGFPWYRRAYAAAIEPANQMPGAGLTRSGETGTHIELGPQAAAEARLVLTLFDQPGTVVGVNEEGSVQIA